MDENAKENINIPQEQHRQPGLESKMQPEPISIHQSYIPSGRFKNKVILISGGDSGIGRAVAYHFAAEGANIAFAYLNETKDANETEKKIVAMGVKCLSFRGDIGDIKFCQEIVKQTLLYFKKIDCLINNAAEQHPFDHLEEITEQQLERTFRTNIFSYFFLTQAVLPHLKKGSTIINTTSVTAYRGSKHLIDYSATKGAIVSFTRSLARNLVEKYIRVNAVAPGPVWTPLIPASFTAEEVAQFGQQTPMQEPAQPADIATSYLFLASAENRFMTGQVLHPNGGEIING